MSGPNISVHRKEYSGTETDIINKALDTDNFIPKIYKHQRVSAGDTANDEVSFDHGLPYPPRGLSWVEIDSDPLTVAFKRGGAIVDNSNTYIIPGNHYDFSTTPTYTSTDNVGVYGVMMLDPLGTPTTKTAPSKPVEPFVTVGGTDGCSDYERKLHSHYDALRVMNSGTLTITAPAEQLTDEDNHWYTATYTHNLGYIPIFAPFVPYSEDLNGYYQWDSQWYSYGGDWTTGLQYGPGHIYDNDGETYKCIKFHTASSTNEPGSGVDWETYWEVWGTSYPSWATSTAYSVGDRASTLWDQWTIGTAYDTLYNYDCSNNGVNYWCIQDHTSSSTNEPGVGVNWEDYWIEYDPELYYCHTAHTSSASTKPGSGANWTSYWWNNADVGEIPDEIYLNEHEQYRFIYGGVFVTKTQAIYFYATKTQLVMKYLRRAYDIGGPMESSKFAAVTITADYTVFYNDLSENFDRLS